MLIYQSRTCKIKVIVVEHDLSKYAILFRIHC